MIHLDTHVVAWLYEGMVDEFPPQVRLLLEQHALAISPMVELELEYLFEIGRARVRGRAVLETLAERIGLTKSGAPFAAVIQHAAHLRWTRDPFDRVIVANAIADDARLVTRDRTIQSHYEKAVWEKQSPRRKGSAIKR